MNGRELDDEAFKILVIKDLAGQTSEQEEELLYSDAERWRDNLDAEMSRIDEEISAQKAALPPMGSRGYFAAGQALAKFRAERMKYRNACNSRCRDVRAYIKDTNEQRSGHSQGTLVEILGAIRALTDEVREIRRVLARRR